MSTPAINSFYDSTKMETDRLEQHVFQLEKARTQELILRYLKPSMTIADIGGATGVYTFWLQDMGHTVHLLDANEFHIEEAKRISNEKSRPLASATLGDARNLPYTNNQFDLALLFGPLYHLQKKEDRVKSISEAKRVLKPGGVLLAATIGRYSSVFDGFWQGFVNDPEFEKIMHQDLIDGNHSNPTDNFNYFTDAHFHTQQEIEEEFTAAGFPDFEKLAIEGFGWLVPDFTTRWEDQSWREKLLSCICQVETDPVMIGISAHVMTIAVK